MTRPRPFRIAFALALCAASTAADEVVLIPGSTVPATRGRISGAIRRETPEAVTIGSTTVPIDQIAEVNYDAQGGDYALAESVFERGEFERAAEQFDKAADGASDPRVARDARARAAFARARIAEIDPSRRDEALDALRTVVDEMSDGRHLGPALERLVRLQLAAGDADEAQRTLGRLARLSWAADRAAVLDALVQLERGRAPEALDGLDGLIRRLGPGDPARLEALLTKARALADSGRFDEAEGVVREVIDDAGAEDAATLAPAYNTLGACLRDAGRARDALFAYLHTDILYPADPDEHARALAAIAELWRSLDRPDRAEEVARRLRESYPNSPYARSASSG